MWTTPRHFEFCGPRKKTPERFLFRDGTGIGCRRADEGCGRICRSGHSALSLLASGVLSWAYSAKPVSEVQKPIAVSSALRASTDSCTAQ